MELLTVTVCVPLACIKRNNEWEILWLDCADIVSQMIHGIRRNLLVLWPIDKYLFLSPLAISFVLLFALSFSLCPYICYTDECAERNIVRLLALHSLVMSSFDVVLSLHGVLMWYVFPFCRMQPEKSFLTRRNKNSLLYCNRLQYTYLLWAMIALLYPYRASIADIMSEHINIFSYTHSMVDYCRQKTLSV